MWKLTIKTLLTAIWEIRKLAWFFFACTSSFHAQHFWWHRHSDGWRPCWGTTSLAETNKRNICSQAQTWHGSCGDTTVIMEGKDVLLSAAEFIFSIFFFFLSFFAPRTPLNYLYPSIKKTRTICRLTLLPFPELMMRSCIIHSRFCMNLSPHRPCQ